MYELIKLLIVSVFLGGILIFLWKKSMIETTKQNKNSVEKIEEKLDEDDLIEADGLSFLYNDNSTIDKMSLFDNIS